MDSEEDQSLAQREFFGTGWWKRSLAVRVGLVAVGSFLMFLCCYGCGKTLDCSPGQQDGQCGFSSFTGIIFGLFLGGSCLVIGELTVLLTWLFEERRRRRQLPTQEFFRADFLLRLLRFALRQGRWRPVRAWVAGMRVPVRCGSCVA